MDKDDDFVFYEFRSAPASHSFSAAIYTCVKVCKDSVGCIGVMFEPKLGATMGECSLIFRGSLKFQTLERSSKSHVFMRRGYLTQTPQAGTQEARDLYDAVIGTETWSEELEELVLDLNEQDAIIPQAYQQMIRYGLGFRTKRVRKMCHFVSHFSRFRCRCIRE
jgi:hypothetical protein